MGTFTIKKWKCDRCGKVEMRTVKVKPGEDIRDVIDRLLRDADKGK